MSEKQKAELSVWRNYNKIPIELLKLCLKMYFVRIDSWNKELSKSIFAINKLTLSLNRSATGYPNAFGNVIVRKSEIMEWKFKIPLGDHVAIVFGIIEADKARNDIQTDFCSVWGDANYGVGFYTYNGKKYSGTVIQIGHDYAEYSSIKDHDIVIMTLDLKSEKGKLSFKTGKSNDENNGILINHGVAFGDIDVDKDYRMGICMFSAKYFVEILP